MRKINTIRYMGNKKKLLDTIVPIVKKITPKDGVVFDAFAGTNSIAFALAEDFRVFTNDIQAYSQVISNALLKQERMDCKKIKKILSELEKFMLEEEKDKKGFFEINYAGTYFSLKQCIEIDRFNEYLKIKKMEDNDILKTAMMFSMTKNQSSPGHFANYFNNISDRIMKLNNTSLFHDFSEKAKEINDIKIYDGNENFRGETLNIIDELEFDTIYIDPPYTNDQYSRFYHILETFVLRDEPNLSHKARYREDRYKSGFSLKTKVVEEFDFLFKKIYDKKANFVLSYNINGVIKLNDLEEIIKKYYKNVNIKSIDFEYSKQGKGKIDTKEIIMWGKYED